MRTHIYLRGEVLFAKIQFSGSIGSKRRPVIVLCTEEFQRAGSKLIVAGITGTVAPPVRPGDVMLHDWAQSGLVKPSAVRGLVTVIDRNEIVRRLGRLSENDFAKVERGVASIRGLTAQR